MMHPRRPHLAWILDEMVNAPHGRQAVLLSSDGLMMAASQNTDQTQADHASAFGAGIQSLARAGGEWICAGTKLRQVVLEFEDGFLLIIAAGESSYLAATADPDVDISAYVYRMADTVKRLSAELGVASRNAPDGTA